MGKLGNACRARAAECALVARAAGWRGDDALKAGYLTLARRWLTVRRLVTRRMGNVIYEMNSPDEYLLTFEI